MSTFKFKRLPARSAWLILPLILSLLMSGVVSFISTVKSVGLVGDVASIWIGAWSLSWLIAFPTLLVLLPVVRRLVSAVVEPGPARG
jgi:Na+/H+-dicarboxylate symporter